jgi:transcriptional regulator of heat shock response
VRLPLEKFPDIEFPCLFVDVPYPGSTPAEVERVLARPIEEALSTVPGIQRMRSTSRADGVQIFIGQESGFRILDDCSVITAPYSADNEVVGVIGVIGPTRMAYERVIPIVDVTAKILGAALARR